MHQPDQEAVGQFERVVGVLDQRLGNVCDIDFGGFERLVSQSPFAQGAEGEEQHADKGNETAGQVGKLAKARVAKTALTARIRENACPHMMFLDGFAPRSAVGSILNSQSSREN